MPATHVKEKIKLPELSVLLQDMPNREQCRCGRGLPDVTFDFIQRSWFVWCECCAASDGMSFLDHAILDFNTKNKK